MITSSYKSTDNVRRFFRAQCGYHFKFARSFTAWIRNNVGKTMGDAVVEWKRRDAVRILQIGIKNRD